jgi:hypothetical protein
MATFLHVAFFLLAFGAGAMLAATICESIETRKRGGYQPRPQRPYDPDVFADSVAEAAGRVRRSGQRQFVGTLYGHEIWVEPREEDRT